MSDDLLRIFIYKTTLLSGTVGTVACFHSLSVTNCYWLHPPLPLPHAVKKQALEDCCCFKPLLALSMVTLLKHPSHGQLHW